MKKETPQRKLCENCDKPIPAARLEALPNTIYCIKCAQLIIKPRQDIPTAEPSDD